MLKKTIKYEDYNGNQREEDFYFNLNKTELIEMANSKSGGLDVLMERLVKQQNVKEILSIVKEIILKAYGEKSDDGKVLMKSEDISHKFECTEAFNVLFVELVENSDEALKFINALLPEDVRNKIAQEQAKLNAQN